MWIVNIYTYFVRSKIKRLGFQGKHFIGGLLPFNSLHTKYLANLSFMNQVSLKGCWTCLSHTTLVLGSSFREFCMLDNYCPLSYTLAQPLDRFYPLSWPQNLPFLILIGVCLCTLCILGWNYVWYVWRDIHIEKLKVQISVYTPKCSQPSSS